MSYDWIDTRQDNRVSFIANKSDDWLDGLLHVMLLSSGWVYASWHDGKWQVRPADNKEDAIRKCEDEFGMKQKQFEFVQLGLFGELI